MPSTIYLDPSMRVATLEARTDAAGSPVTDISGLEFRLYADLLTEGVIGATAWQVAPGAGMSVDVGSGVDGDDLVVIAGASGGQGSYLAELSGGLTNVPVPAADLGQTRLDEVYAIVQDSAFDASGLVKARIGYRQGDLGGAIPGEDPSWTAAVLLARITVAPGVSDITVSDIADQRVQSQLKVQVDPEQIGAATGAEFDAHAAASNPHGTSAADVGADPAGSAAGVQSNLDSHAGTPSPHSGHLVQADMDSHAGGPDHDGRYYRESEVDAKLDLKANVGHGHGGTYSTVGHDHDSDYYDQATVDSKDQAVTGYRHQGAPSTPNLVTISDQEPSGGGTDGDLWFRYQ